jgi:hypothetical protein
MGWNTTVVILNDALHNIESDPEFGRKLADAVKRAINRRECPIRISAGGFSPAAVVVETHDGGSAVTVEVHGNTGRVVKTEFKG